MSQLRIRLVSSEKGSSTAVVGSGISTMSDSLMPFQPAIDEPSNILPFREHVLVDDAGRHRHVLLLAARVGKAQIDELTSLSFMSFRTSFAADMAWTSPGFGCD